MSQSTSIAEGWSTCSVEEIIVLVLIPQTESIFHYKCVLFYREQQNLFANLHLIVPFRLLWQACLKRFWQYCATLVVKLVFHMNILWSLGITSFCTNFGLHRNISYMTTDLFRIVTVLFPLGNGERYLFLLHLLFNWKRNWCEYTVTNRAKSDWISFRWKETRKNTIQAVMPLVFSESYAFSKETCSHDLTH